MKKLNAVISILVLFSINLVFTQVTDVGSKKFEMNFDEGTLKIPYYSNKVSVDVEDPLVKRVVIAIHGSSGNGNRTNDKMLDAVEIESGERNPDTLMVIAPQYLRQEDLAPNNLDNEHLYWSNQGWRIGFTSRKDAPDDRPLRVSSYSVMDSLMVRLAKNLPNLETVILTGHSAGGQFVNRYSATTPIVDQLLEQGIGIRFISNNPSSYVYMDTKRRVGSTLDQFAVPTGSCTTYNEYKYGLDDLPTYLRNIGGAEVIRDRLKTREVVYLVGGSDNDPNYPQLDNSCDALLQGLHRLERGAVYFNYLKDFYGEQINDLQIMDTVPLIGHSSGGMYQSSIGRFYTFRKPLINNLLLSVDELEDAIASFDIFPNPTRNIVNIKGELLAGAEVTIQLFDLSGKEVYSEMTKSGKQQFTLPVLPNGVYLFSYVLDKKRTSVHKLVISN